MLISKSSQSKTAWRNFAARNGGQRGQFFLYSLFGQEDGGKMSVEVQEASGTGGTTCTFDAATLEDAQDSPSSVSNDGPVSHDPSPPPAPTPVDDSTPTLGETLVNGVVTPEAARDLDQSSSSTTADNGEPVAVSSEQDVVVPPRPTLFLTAPAQWSSHHLMTEQETTESSSGSTSSTTPKNMYQRLCCARRRHVILCVGACLVLATILVVAIVVPLSNNNKNNTSTRTDNTNGDFVYNANDVARMNTFLLQQHWSDPLTLFDATSPQTRAMHQLAALYKDNGKEELNATRIQQQYGLLVVWYGLGGGTRDLEENECQEWNTLVDCNHGGEIIKLKMWRRGLNGRILEEVALLNSIESIDMFENMIQGPLPTALYRLSKLTNLQLGNNDITSELSEDIGQLSNLENLHLHDNNMFGPLPASMRFLTNLKVVQLWRTQLEGPIVEFAVDWPNLEDLTIAESELFDGTIPSELGTLTNLDTFMIQSTSVEGTVPTEVGNLSSLSRFMLGHQLAIDDDTKTPVGTLPSEIGKCLQLNALSIEASRMGGTLPATVGILTSLETLRFKGADFSGTLPDSFQNLVNLTSLVLQGNSFSGSLPDWLGTSLPKLEYLAVYWNNFTGPVPESLCREGLEFYYDCHNPCDCCGLCGSVEPGVTRKLNGGR